MRLAKKRKPPVDVPRLLERLGIRARRLAGTKLVALCPHPEHRDKTPSWFIRDDLGGDFHATHCCKSCGFQGGTLSLVEGVLGLSREEAETWLEDLRLPIPQPLKIQVEIREPAPRYHVCEYPEEIVSTPLETWDAPAREYLSTRGITPQEVLHWRLGHVPKKVRHRLRGRVVLPFLDRAGRVLGYTARDYTGHGLVRYLSASTEEHPSPAAIFGELHWRDQRVCVVVEGAIDAIAAARVLGGAVAVAALAGSSPHTSQLNKLAPRYRDGKRVGGFELLIVATDNDKAGNRAAQHLRLQLGSHLEVRRACPPEGQDIASMDDVSRAAFLSGIIG